MAANFDELLPKVSTWDVEEEEKLINKIKQMTEDYQQKCSDLSINLNNMTRNLHLIEVDFFNALNGLKIVSGQKFIEHLIDTEDIKPEEETEEKKEEEINEQTDSINNIMQRSMDFIALRDQQKSQNKNNVEDDTVSMNSKVMDNNLMKNNRGLKLPMIIGTKDFKENDYIGLVLDDDKEEEDNVVNEMKNEQGIEIPKEEQGPEEENINNLNNNNLNNNNNNLNNNPEAFHNMVQQQMGKPIKSQNMFEAIEENKENEKEFVNPVMESMKVDDDANVGGLGGLLRQSSLQPNMNNNIGNSNNSDNLNKTKTIVTPMGKPKLGGKISLSNFLSRDIFGDDDEDEDTSGLFGRPPGKKGLGMSMVTNNNMMLNNNNNIQNSQNQNMMNINQMQMNPGLNPQYQYQVNNAENISQVQNNNNNNINNINNMNNNQIVQEKPYYEQNQNAPMNQGMEMNQMNNMQMGMGQSILNNNGNKKEEESDDDNLDDFQKRKKKLERMMGQGPKPKIMMPLTNNENMNNNQELNQQNNNIEMNNNIINNTQYNNIQMNNVNNNNEINNVNNNINQFKNNNTLPYNSNQNIIKMSQRDLENKRRLENAKSKINSIFGDDDEEDDIFSKKMTFKNAEKIEEKSQNLQERLNQLTSSYPSETNNINNNNNKINNLFENNNPSNNILNTNNQIQSNMNNNILNNNNINKSSTKKKFFLDDDEEDLNLKIPNKNVNQIN